ncbi:Attractin DPPT-L [Takifugu flavidus]|uniref:Attractin DPPT-L n=1 Tax=Takifugu flavidus TaxID=433684 RepID=A0A5C6P363_9TELE|nr:Attractin DPPT-L [Takifugu flavidus]
MKRNGRLLLFNEPVSIGSVPTRLVGDPRSCVSTSNSLLLHSRGTQMLGNQPVFPRCRFFNYIPSVPKPIALEPCFGNKAAVLSIFVRLPRGAGGIPPPGQSGELSHHSLPFRL